MRSTFATGINKQEGEGGEKMQEFTTLQYMHTKLQLFDHLES